MGCPDYVTSAARTLAVRAGENGAAGTVQAPAGGAARLREHDSGAGRASQRWKHTSSLPLASLRSAPQCGRLHAWNILQEWNLSHLADDAGLLISEMLTNAVNATRDPICLRLLADHLQLIIEVWDCAPANPKPRIADSEDEGGRGCAVMQATANRWGYQRVSDRQKVVWAELLV
jgi:anti-sigma regulatory factor (Ser/Thr protein kinase)